MSENLKKRIAILGSTGSIGRQTLDVCSQHPDMFQVEMLTANTSSALLIEQALKFDPNCVVICDSSKYQEVFDALDPHGIKVFSGIESVEELVKGDNIDIVLTAMVGFAGLRPTLAAIKAGKTIALANKETLVAAGSLVTQLAAKYHAPILPVDSEHSAIFQCLHCGSQHEVEKLVLTCSGGPFRQKSREEVFNATVEQALAHPKWNMGAKITVDSASLMNKGLEIIEAKWLFGMQPEDIEVVIHPESIIHSMVRFRDGAIIAQLSDPDMRIPIQFALAYPERLELNTARTDFPALGSMSFFAPDPERFPCLQLAYKALQKGGNTACAMNAANEVAVAAFLQQKIAFGQIPEVIDYAMSRTSFVADPQLEDIFETNAEAERIAKACLN